MHVRILLLGFGPVGRAFAELIERKRVHLQTRYDLDLQLVGVATSRATWIPRGKRPDDVLEIVEQVQLGRPLGELPGVEVGCDGAWALASIDAEVVAEVTPTNLRDGEPGWTHLRLALQRGSHVAAASKGALVRHFAELRDLARSSGARLRFSAATAAALPTVDVALHGLAGADILRVEGILNGTTNFILGKMAEDQASFESALAEAQRLGIAERDPSLDVEGWDTASKLVLLANAVWDAGLRLDEVAVRGIAGLDVREVTEPAAQGQALKLVGSLWRENGRVGAAVAPRALARDHPLAQIKRTQKGATFVTDTMDSITVTGGKSDPLGAAAALLRDVIHLVVRV